MQLGDPRITSNVSDGTDETKAEKKGPQRKFRVQGPARVALSCFWLGAGLGAVEGGCEWLLVDPVGYRSVRIRELCDWNVAPTLSEYRSHEVETFYS